MKYVNWQLMILICCCTTDLHAADQDDVMRVGIVGCDTTHVIEFTKLINASQEDGATRDLKVVVAYAGGSDDIPDSRNRVRGFADQLRAQGVKMVDSADIVVEQCDAILLESLDGRVHLEQFRAVARGKPVFVDKPLAASLADIMAIFHHADQTNTPCFSASASRYVDQVNALINDDTAGETLGCETAGPLKIEPHHPDLFWYGIHGVEALYTLMGRGCETVCQVESPMSALVIGKWHDGRIGSFRGIKHGKSSYAFTLYGKNSIVQRQGFSGYEQLVQHICEFFVSRQPPVNRLDTIELYAFMEAADESKSLGGTPVAIADVILRAEQQSGQVNSGQSSAAER